MNDLINIYEHHHGQIHSFWSVSFHTGAHAISIILFLE